MCKVDWKEEQRNWYSKNFNNASSVSNPARSFHHLFIHRIH